MQAKSVSIGGKAPTRSEGSEATVVRMGTSAYSVAMPGVGTSLIFSLWVTLALQGSLGGIYEGKYQDESARVTLQESNGAVTGSALFFGSSYKLSGIRTGSSAKGKMIGSEESLVFRASVNGDALTFEYTDEDSPSGWAEADRATLSRRGKPAGQSTSTPAQPSGKKPSKEKPSGTKPPKKQTGSMGGSKPIALLSNGKEYVHPSGGKFRLPKTWKVVSNAQTGGIELVPDSKRESLKILMMSDSAQGETNPASAEVQSLLDQQVAQLDPNAQRIEGPTRVQAGAGSGATYAWKAGTGVVRVYLTIIKGRATILLAAGATASIAAHEKTLREIFTTLGWGQGKLDSRLVGRWLQYTYIQATGRETKSFATLKLDGMFILTTDSESSSNMQGTNQYGDVLWTGGTYNRQSGTHKGSWSADGNALYLTFEDGGFEQFTYRFEQQGTAFVMKLFKTGSSKGVEWSKQ